MHLKTILCALVTLCVVGMGTGAVGEAATPSPTSPSPTGTATSATAQIADPAVLLQTTIDALNRGDLATSSGAFADGGTFQGTRGCLAPCVGKAAVTAEFQRLIGDHTVITLTSKQTAGTSVTARAEVRSDGIRSLNLQRIIDSFAMQSSSNKITSLKLTLDTTDPETAALLSVIARGFTPPSTGSGGWAGDANPSKRFAEIAVAFGLGLVTLVAGIARRSRRSR